MSGHSPEQASDISYVTCFEEAIREIAPLETWRVDAEEFWCYVEPPGHSSRLQGWKIHVSATPKSAETVLARAARVLIRRRAAFKFTRGLVQLRELMSIRCERSAGGKFITVYPNDDDHFVQLLDELHEATEGLAGPAILSDRPYRPESLVHYRYGGFTKDLMVLDVDGSYAPMLVDPSGAWVKDERQAWFSPPAWAKSPLTDTPGRKPDSELGNPVLLDGRFVVKEAIRHSNRGGVYRAVDQETGDRVIIKQARPHVGADLHDGDARDFLRNEAEILDLLAPLGITPRKKALFDHGGHLFLAQERLDGKSLREWLKQDGRDPALGRPRSDDVWNLARQLVDIMRAIHDKGLVLRDFNPGNVLVDQALRLWLIDTEFVATPGEEVVNALTMGYAAPEQVSAGHNIPAPAQTVDLYSLGATLLFLCSGAEPVLPNDDPPSRPIGERLRSLAESVAKGNPLVRTYLPAIKGLIADDPAKRWSLDRVSHLIEQVEAAVHVDESLPSARLTRSNQERLLMDGLRAMARAATPEDRYVYPPIRWEGLTGDPCSLQSGAAGPVEVFRRALQVCHEAELAESFEAVTRWLDRRMANERRFLPGLYFGKSGAVWALYEAADWLGDEDLRQRALEFAKRVPVRWDNPDLTHGLAGAGMAHLHLWRRTADEAFRDRTLSAAHTLVESCQRRGSRVAWPIPAEFRSELAGLSHYGFAHGVAGVSTFLLAVAREFDRPDLREIAVAGGEVMLEIAIRDGDAMRWPSGEDIHPEGVAWWCSGSGGVGAFLIRLWLDTGDDRFREHAHGAAIAVRGERWLQTTVHCHGLAGSGELLLDMAAATGDEIYRAWAEEVATALYARHAVRDGLCVVPGENPLSSVAYSYNLGLAGILGFFHRLRHGGPRWWMVDDFELAPAAGTDK